MATQQERRERTRRKLLQSARALIVARGYEATSVDAIVRRANLAKGTFYQHFPGKRDLALALGRDDMKAVGRRAREEMERGRSAPEVLRAVFAETAKRFEASPELAAVVVGHARSVSTGRADRDPHGSVRGELETIVQRGQAAGTIRKDVPADQLADLLGGVMVQALVAWRRDPTGPPVGQHLDRLLGVVLDGARLRRRSR